MWIFLVSNLVGGDLTIGLIFERNSYNNRPVLTYTNVKQYAQLKKCSSQIEQCLNL